MDSQTWHDLWADFKPTIPAILIVVVLAVAYGVFVFPHSDIAKQNRANAISMLAQSYYDPPNARLSDAQKALLMRQYHLTDDDINPTKILLRIAKHD